MKNIGNENSVLRGEISEQGEEKMIAKVQSYALAGLEGVPVTVETDISRGLPSYEMVGLPDAAVKESKERVRSAIKNSVLEFPAHKITVNLAPAYVRKEGSAFDLPIAISLLLAYGALRAEVGKTVFLGELALNGELRPVTGVLPALISARDKGYTDFIVPKANEREAGYIHGIRVYAPASLRETVDHLSGLKPLSPVPAAEFSSQEREKNLRSLFRQGAARRQTRPRSGCRGRTQYSVRRASGKRKNHARPSAAFHSSRFEL